MTTTTGSTALDSDTRKEWVTAVLNGDTLLGFADWYDRHWVCDVCGGTGINICEETISEDTGINTRAWIERCDTCEIYQGDLDAMQAYALQHRHAQIGWQQNGQMRWIDANALIPLDAMQDFGTTGQTRRYADAATIV